MQPLHAKYLIQLLLETRAALKQKANINYATTSIAKQMTVCGDLHGKLDDLYMIFHKVSKSVPVNERIKRHKGFLIAWCTELLLSVPRTTHQRLQVNGDVMSGSCFHLSSLINYRL